MKKIMYLAAALLVMAGCKNNQNEPEAPINGQAFEKGDKVTITVGEDQVKAPVRKINGTISSSSTIDFTWETNDSLFITVGSNTAIFRLTKGAGTANGTFEGEMPAGGETFTAEYRGQYADNINGGWQNYTENGIDMDYIHAKAENCVVANSSSSINLVVDNAAALILNLQCDKVLSLLSVEDAGGKAPIHKGGKGESCSAYLYFGEGLQLSASTPTKIAILLPEGLLNTQLAIDFKADEIKTPNFTLTDAAVGGAVNYPLKKWVNLNLLDENPGRVDKQNGVQLCAIGEKATLNFVYRKDFIEDTKVKLTVGEHVIFNKNINELITLTPGQSIDTSFYDAEDDNREYKLHITCYQPADYVLAEFSITATISEYSFGKDFTVKTTAGPQ